MINLHAPDATKAAQSRSRLVKCLGPSVSNGTTGKLLPNEELGLAFSGSRGLMDVPT